MTAGPTVSLSGEGDTVTEAEWLGSDDPRAMLGLTVTGPTLWKKLHEAGCLAETKGGTGKQPLRLVVPRKIEGGTRMVIVRHAERLFPQGEGG
jgi:hypothetical protein